MSVIKFLATCNKSHAVICALTSSSPIIFIWILEKKNWNDIVQEELSFFLIVVCSSFFLLPSSSAIWKHYEQKLLKAKVCDSPQEDIRNACHDEYSKQETKVKRLGTPSVTCWWHHDWETQSRKNERLKFKLFAQTRMPGCNHTGRYTQNRYVSTAGLRGVTECFE